MIFLNDFVFVQPEIFLFTSLLVLSCMGIFSRVESVENRKKIFSDSLHLALFSLIVTFILLLRQPNVNYVVFGSYTVNSLESVTMLMLILMSFFVVLFSRSFFEYCYDRPPEFFMLIFTAIMGMVYVVASKDLIAFYLALELQGLCFYALAGLHAQSYIYSAEAGLKYFILGSTASILILFGSTLVYGFTGLTALADFSNLCIDGASIKYFKAMLVGLTFVVIGVAFKFPAAPFHNWAPDVYYGSPTVVTMFFIVAPKFAMLLFLSLLVYFYFPFFTFCTFFLLVCGAVSLLIGSFGALHQMNIKKFLAYTSISHVGFIFISLSSMTIEGLHSSFLYLFIYSFMNLVFFVVLIGARRCYGARLERLGHLFDLYGSYPVLSYVLAVNMFSIAGIPPLAGFFSKYYIFLALMQCGMIPYAILLVVISAVSCLYYIRFVKNMYFTKLGTWGEVLTVSYELAVVGALTFLFNASFFLFVTSFHVFMVNMVFSVIY